LKNVVLFFFSWSKTILKMYHKISEKKKKNNKKTEKS